MGSFTSPTVLDVDHGTNLKTVVLTVLGSNSYATGGDTIDLSEATIGSGNGFALVHKVEVGLAAGATASNSKYHGVYLPATAYAAATGLIKFHDLTAASDAEVSNTTDLSAITFLIRVSGR